MTKSLNFFSKALPVKGRAFFLRTKFNKSLLESFKYLLDACREVIPRDIFLRGYEIIASFDPHSKLSGFLSLLHADLFRAMEQNDIQKVNEIVCKICENNFQVSDINYVNISNLNSYYAPLVRHVFSQETIATAKFADLPPKEYERVINSFHRGFESLQRISPDLFQESQQLISEVLVMNAEGLKGGSSFELFGMIYVSYPYKWEKLTEILDLITHEQAHLYIYLVNKDDQLVLNPLEKDISPLRPEQRPLIGSYHATFVLARVSYVLQLALTLDEIPSNEREYCRDLLSYYQERFFVGYEMLNRRAQMTPLGRALLGHKIGDKVIAQTPKGPVEYKIVELS